MRVNVKDENKDLNYDYLFLSIELLKKIDFTKRLGEKITIFDYENSLAGISFSIENEKEIIDVSLELIYNGRAFKLTLYTHKNVLEYEFDSKNQKLLCESVTIDNENKSLRRTLLHQENKEYMYDLIDDNYGNLLIRYKTKKIINDEDLFSYLLGNTFDFNDMVNEISNQIINGSCYIKFQNEEFEETFNLIDNELVVVENNYFTEPVFTKIYKNN